MSKRSKEKAFHFSFQVLLRLIVFVVIVFLTINYLSSNSLAINIRLPNLFQYLPPQSQQVLGEATDYFASQNVNTKIEELLTYIRNFPEKHLKQIKIDIINYLAKELINRIDQP